MRASSTLCLIVVGPDGGLESLGVGAYHLLDLLAVLEEDEGGHGTDAEFLCDIGNFVDVELVEARIGECGREPWRV